MTPDGQSDDSSNLDPNHRQQAADLPQSERAAWVADVSALVDALVDSAEPELERDVADWHGLAMAGTQWAKAVASGSVINIAEVGVGLLGSILNVEAAQDRLLRSVDENVEVLRQQPYETGLLYLQEALHVGADPRESRWVVRAQDSFFEAEPLAAPGLEKVAVATHVGLCALLTGNLAQSARWLSRAYAGVERELQEALGKLMPQGAKPRQRQLSGKQAIGSAVVGSAVALGPAALVVLPVVAVKWLIGVRNDKRPAIVARNADDSRRTFAPGPAREIVYSFQVRTKEDKRHAESISRMMLLAHCVAALHNSVAVETPLEPPVITKTDDDYRARLVTRVSR